MTGLPGSDALTKSKEALRKYGLLATAIVLGVIVLVGEDLAKTLPPLSGVTSLTVFTLIDEVQDLLSLAISLYAAYRWTPRLGIAGMALYLAAHIPYLLSNPTGTLPDAVRIFLVTVAGVVGAHMISKALRIKAEADERNLRLASLYQMSQEMSLSLDADALGTRALETALTILKLDSGTIRSIDENTQELVMLSHRGLPTSVARDIQASPVLKMGQGIAGKVAQSGEPLIIESVPAYQDTAYGSTRTSGLQSGASLPLKVQGKVVGVITGFSVKKRTFTPADLELMASLGNMVGMAISNSQMFRAMEAKSKEWERTFDSAGEGIALVSPDFKIVRANRSLAAILNTNPQALVGQSCYKAIHGLDEPPKTGVLHRCVAEQQPLETVVQEPHLGNRWFQIRIDPVLDQKGKLISIIHTMTDVTQRKKAEETLARSLSLTKAMLDIVRIAGKGLVTRDVYSAFAAELQKLVPFDEASINLLGRAGNVLRVLTIRAGNEVLLTSGQITPLEGSAIEWVVRHNKTQLEEDISEKRQVEIDESLVQEGYHAILRVPLCFGSQPFGVFELKSRPRAAYGASEQKVIEQLCSVLASVLWYQHIVALEVTERRELEEMDKAREQFTHFLAHELRTPLTPIKASALVLAQHFPKEAGSPEFRCVKNIITGAENMEARLTDLLDMAQFRIGAFTLKVEAIDPGSLINRVASSFEPLAKSNQQSLTVDLPRQLPTIKADGQRLEQVLMNLLDNALKFTPKGGSIRLTAAIRDKQLVIEVQDNGPGLSAQEKLKLFQPYWRGNPEGDLPGSGLGLALCKRLVEAHGGRIWAESEVGRGSIFCVALPTAGPISGGGEKT